MHLHFVYLVILLLAGAAVHIASLPDRSVPRGAELVLLYLLVGYCGVPMLIVSVWALARPDQIGHLFGFVTAGPLLAFFGWAYLGMSLVAIAALRYRGTYLVAAVLVWAVYLGGATVVHLTAFGSPSEGRVLEIFASHGLIAVLLVAALIASGFWRRPV